MKNTITYANRLYSLKETFDVNLTLDYENDSWSEWHIIRELSPMLLIVLIWILLRLRLND